LYVVLPGCGGDYWNRGDHVARSVGGKTALRPVNVSDEMQELEIRWYAFSLAPRREHVVRKVEFIVFPAVVLAEESLNKLIAYDSSNPLSTPPTITVHFRGICGPRHIATTGITLHLTPKQPDIF